LVTYRIQGVAVTNRLGGICSEVTSFLFTQLLVWYLLLLLFGLVGLPVALFLFRHLPDCDYVFSRALGLLLVGYSTWLLTILGFIHFGVVSLTFLTLCLGAAGWGILITQHRHALVTLRDRWRDLVGCEIIFLAAFLFMTWLRTFDPHPQGTERPMDYAFFNAIMRSQKFPPHDPWLSGYAINYYYFGYLLMGALTLLSGVDPGIGYNLSLATLFALTAVHVAALIYSLAVQTNDGQNPHLTRRFLRLMVALLGVLLVLVAGNQAAVLQIIARTEKVVALDGRQLWVAICNGLRGNPEYLHLPYATPQTLDFGAIQDVILRDTWQDFNWWWPSRALWDDYQINGVIHRRYNITEFPFFSFYLGDMHPHVMALPYTIMVAALGLALMRQGSIPQWWGDDRLGRLSFLLHATALGGLYFLNSWDFPTYTLLMLGSLLWVYVRNHNANGHSHWRNLATQVAALPIASIVLYLPFYVTFRSFIGSGEVPSLLGRIPLFGRLLKIIGIVGWSRSGLHQVFVIFGLFLVPIGAYMVFTAPHARWRPPAWAHACAMPLQVLSGQRQSAWRWAILIAFVLGVTIHFPLLGLLPVAIYALLLSLATPEAATAFTYMSIGLMASILFSTEVFYIRDIFGNRMNTIFKFYYQVWTMGGILAAYSIWALLYRTPVKRRFLTWLTMVSFGILLAGALVYPMLAIRDRTKGVSQGLKGLTTRQMRSQAEQDAVVWLRTYVSPNAVVLEAVGTSYDGTGIGAGGISGATGLQTVLGWPGHEEQWRLGAPSILSEIDTRRTDVETIYTSQNPEKVQSLLKKYNIRYVVVGDSERQAYPGLNMHVLDSLMNRVFVSTGSKMIIFERLTSN
jgi:YYY domain-containing protein